MPICLSSSDTLGKPTTRVQSSSIGFSQISRQSLRVTSRTASRLLRIAAGAGDVWAEERDEVGVVNAFFLEQQFRDGIELRAVFGEQL